MKRRNRTALAFRAMPEDPVHVTWLNSDRPVPSRFVRPFIRFTQIEAAGGIVILVAAAVALIWANASFGEGYETFWNEQVELDLGILHINESLRDFVNDGLMAIFFFVVGLEIKRELVRGDLSTPKRAALPALAALGGMIFPALIYVAIVGSGAGSRGWGIPMATDIAFSVGLVALLSSRVPIGAKLFLLALAIVDDIGAIVVIAAFYTSDLNFGWLAASLAALVAIRTASKAGIRNIGVYVVIGGFAWLALLESGVHATLAGVALGLLTPAHAMYSDEEYRQRASWILSRYDMDARSPRAKERLDQQALELAAVARESVSPLDRLEVAIHPWSSFVIVPIFALANAGIRFADIDVGDAITSPVATGVALGLIVGKTVGISLFSFLAVRLGLASLPRATTWRHILGVAVVAGIGFTVSLFITELAFTAPELIDRAKIGIFIGSGVAGIAGYLILRSAPRVPEPSPPKAPESAVTVPGR